MEWLKNIFKNNNDNSSIKSFTNSEIEYIINLNDITCSCKDWSLERYVYPKNDPRRLCKHIIRELDLENLNNDLKYFREKLIYYKEKEKGFTKHINNIIYVEEADCKVICKDGTWQDVCNSQGISYAIAIHYLNFQWTNRGKPLNYRYIENLFLNYKYLEAVELFEEEKQFIIDLLKKAGYYKISFEIAVEYEQIPNQLIYKIDYKDEKGYRYTENYIYVTNENFRFSNMFSEGYQTYEIFYRDKIKVNQKQEIEFQKKQKQIYENRLLEDEYEKIREIELEEKRQNAKNKGYFLSEDYKGAMYYIQNDVVHPNNISWDEYYEIKNGVLGRYDTLSNLIKKNFFKTTTSNFNKILIELNFIKKDKTLNQNDWIIYGEGLNYGINLIKDSKYMHKNIPNWYKVQIFDTTKIKIVTLESNINIKMTSALFDKNKFNELYQLYKKEIEKKATEKNKLKMKTLAKYTEREKWLRHIACPNCDEKTNIHKKDKRERTEYIVQRFYCNECKSMFQIRVDELEKKIQDYEENK